MNTPKTWKDAREIDLALEEVGLSLQQRLRELKIENPLMVGIHTGGVWVAEKLHQTLELDSKLGSLDIAFYRDDYTRIGVNPVVKPSHMPESVDDRHIILVDDVLHTGRTIRAALNELFDYGRPASVTLVVLAERSGRDLPIEPAISGLHLELNQGQHIKLTGPDPLALVIDRNRPPRDDA